MRQVLCSRLVGRDGEMAAIGAALAAARAGHGGAVVMLGEAGVGKSRLIREAEALARSLSVQALRGRAVEGSTGAYRPIAEALLSFLRSGRLDGFGGVEGLGEHADLKPFRSILGRLIPEWRQDGGQPAGRLQPVADDSTVLLGEGILRLLRILGRGRGCLLVLDDLHWADADSLALIEYLTDNLRAEPVLLLAAIRSDERSEALALAQSMAARRMGQVIELSRLDRVDVEDMARICLDVADCPEGVVELLGAYTDGLPFLIEELLAAWIGSGALVQTPGGWEVADELPPVAPLTFAHSVNRRLGGLGSESRRILQAAAVLGRYFDWTLLAPATGLGEAEVLERLHGAIDAQLIAADVPSTIATQERGHGRAGFGFRHALTRAAVLAEMLPPERAALSDRMLSLVEEAHPGLPGEWRDLAVRLAEAAGRMDRATQLLLAAGRHELARGALATAEHALERARRLNPDDLELLVEIEDALTETLSLAGKWEMVFAVGERLLADLRALEAPDHRAAEVHIRLARAALAAGRWSEATGHVERARELAGPHSPDTSEPVTEVLARVAAVAAHVAIERTRPDEATAYARAALERAEHSSLPEIACEALEVLGRCARVRDLDLAEAFFERGRAIAEENSLTVWRIRALHELGTIEIFKATRNARLREAHDLAVRSGALATAAMVDIQLAAYHDQRGESEDTLASARRSVEMARRLHLDVTTAVALTFEAVVFARMGNRVAMEEANDEALRLAGGVPDVVAGVWESRGFAAFVEEKRTQALHAFEKSVEAVQGMSVTTPGPYHGFWALLRTIEGIDGDEAHEAVLRSGVTINPVNRAYLDYAEAITLGRAGRSGEAEAAAARANGALVTMGWFRHCGNRLLAEAAVEDRWGNPATWLWEARAYFESAGYDRLASACASLLRRTGASGPRIGRSRAGVPATLRALGVTRREMEVLSVLAEGLSNREIGERLFLSPRTVEKHVASLMAKTETRSRVQLAALAAAP